MLTAEVPVSDAEVEGTEGLGRHDLGPFLHVGKSQLELEEESAQNITVVTQ